MLNIIGSIYNKYNSIPLIQMNFSISEAFPYLHVSKQMAKILPVIFPMVKPGTLRHQVKSNCEKFS